jgi:hypothetical protein
MGRLSRLPFLKEGTSRIDLPCGAGERLDFAPTANPPSPAAQVPAPFSKGGDFPETALEEACLAFAFPFAASQPPDGGSKKRD